jgi:hypothetical protein
MSERDLLTYGGCLFVELDALTKSPIGLSDQIDMLLLKGKASMGAECEA